MVSAAVVTLVTPLVAGCTIERPGDETGMDRQRGGERDGDGAGEETVPLEVISHAEGTLALVPVRIEGEGPFLFGLDTGASNTVVDEDLVERVGLEQVGTGQPSVGVGGPVETVSVRVEEWRIGDVELDPATVSSLDLPNPRGEGLEGLFGSDVLSRFGSITIDYEAQQLILGS